MAQAAGERKDQMGEIVGVIQTKCPDFVCRLCRTKTGWPHQRWCSYRKRTTPECQDCRYYDRRKDQCLHPGRDKPLRKHQVNL